MSITSPLWKASGGRTLLGFARYSSAFKRSCSRTRENHLSTRSSSYEKDENLTHFGYSKVLETEKADKVYKVFEGVAESYDLMNDLMSGGVHRLWKNYFVKQLHPKADNSLLDVAGGTGDIAFRYIDAVARAHRGRDFRLKPAGVVVCDVNKEMLKVGKRRAERNKLEDGLPLSAFLVVD